MLCENHPRLASPEKNCYGALTARVADLATQYRQRQSCRLVILNSYLMNKSRLRDGKSWRYFDGLAKVLDKELLVGKSLGHWNIKARAQKRWAGETSRPVMT